MNTGPLACSTFLGAYFFSTLGYYLVCVALCDEVCFDSSFVYSFFAGFYYLADFYPLASGSISKNGLPTSRLSPSLA